MKKHNVGKTICFSLKILSIISTFFSVIALSAIIFYVIKNGIGNLSLSLIFSESGNKPTILPAILGTLHLILISVVIAVPIGVGSAVFLVEYAKNKGKFVKIISVATETLAGIPSIVYGLFGYLIFVVAFKMGYTILGGGFTLSIMILPLIVRSTQESLLSVPNGLREGALALGTSKVRTIFKVILPSCASGIVTSIILAIGRVVSESAVLILTIGMVTNKMPQNVLMPGTSLALDIYYFANYGLMKEPTATSVVLLILVILINLSANLIGKAIKKRTGEF